MCIPKHTVHVSLTIIVPVPTYFRNTGCNQSPGLGKDEKRLEGTYYVVKYALESYGVAGIRQIAQSWLQESIFCSSIHLHV